MRGDHLRSPEQVSAHREVELALRDKRLTKGPCYVCKLQGITQDTVDAHHTDYATPLSVVWMCRKHHRRFHVLADRRLRGGTSLDLAKNRDEVGLLLLEPLQPKGGNLPVSASARLHETTGASSVVLDVHHE